ncbi:MAG: TRAP transporter small permease [Desulfarculaceae bacterium]|nr:TRAP transporter small permease [Desulfarculaceae bacterium]MCF8074214.1 TRAP transporter small permease [Desulfarculaceae bacterium]MCF8103834.1 TRAP transporter small permease [Desulfarculaceae bacterium]MCF8116350.1 TRAP transporter small permease [Desulfarculaceae bacterium]
MRRLLKAINHLEEAVLATGLLGLALMAFGEVVSRYLFNHSFTWFEEFARYFCVFLTFLGASLGVRYGMHFSMDYLVTKVGPRIGHWMRIAGFLISAALFLVVAYYAWEHAWKMKRFGTTSAAMGLPMFWAYLPIAVFSATLALRFMAQAWRHLKAWRAGLPLEAAAPAGEQAA